MKKVGQRIIPALRADVVFSLCDILVKKYETCVKI